MQQDAYIAGIGTTPFGNHLDRGLKSLAGEAITTALADAGLSASDIEAAWMGNVASGIVTGQVCINGQAILRELGIGAIPVVNVKNACATASTALNQASTMVTLRGYDIALAMGVEKLFHEDKSKTFSVFSGCIDTEDAQGVIDDLARRKAAAGIGTAAGDGGMRSLFMDIYATLTLKHMQQYGSTREQFAAIAAKNSRHGQYNPNAQFRETQTIADVLAAREVTYPLTLPMCSPIGDGAAAAIVVSPRVASRIGLSRCVRIRSCVLSSGADYSDPQRDIVSVASTQAYTEAGLGPNDVDVVELHDATAPSELMHYETLGLCGKGEGGRMIVDGETEIGGRIPVNPSGGLLRRGHAIGASGLAQIHELVTQLRGEASPRQVENARIALAENGGGYLAGDAAAMVITLLEGPSQ